MEQSESSQTDSVKAGSAHRQQKSAAADNNNQRPSAIQRQLSARAGGTAAPTVNAAEPAAVPEHERKKPFATGAMLLLLLVVAGVCLVVFKDDWQRQLQGLDMSAIGDYTERVSELVVNKQQPEQEPEAVPRTEFMEATATPSGENSPDSITLSQLEPSQLSTDDINRYMANRLEEINQAAPEDRERLTRELIATVTPLFAAAETGKEAADAESPQEQNSELLSEPQPALSTEVTPLPEAPDTEFTEAVSEEPQPVSTSQDAIASEPAEIITETVEQSVSSEVISEPVATEPIAPEPVQPYIEVLDATAGHWVDEAFVPAAGGSVLMISFAYSNLLPADKLLETSRLIVRLRVEGVSTFLAQQAVALPGDRGTSSVPIDTGGVKLDDARFYLDFFYAGELIANQLFDYRAVKL